jgi:hypothetical protein
VVQQHTRRNLGEARAFDCGVLLMDEASSLLLQPAAELQHRKNNQPSHETRCQLRCRWAYRQRPRLQRPQRRDAAKRHSTEGSQDPFDEARPKGSIVVED